MKKRVLQGHSVMFGGVWYNQNDVFECGPEDVFRTMVDNRDVEQTENVAEDQAIPDSIPAPVQITHQEEKEEG